MQTVHCYRWEDPEGAGPCSGTHHAMRVYSRVVIPLWADYIATHPGMESDWPRYTRRMRSLSQCATTRRGFRVWWPAWACKIARENGFRLVRYTMRSQDVVVGLSGHQVFIRRSRAVAKRVLVKEKA